MKRLKEMLKQKKFKIISFIILIVVVSIIALVFIPNSKALPVVAKNLNITSKNTSYLDEESGSFSINKSAEWTGYKKVRVTFDVDTVGLFEETYTDIIFVLDVSGSMEGEKIERVKSDASELVDTLLSNPMNRAALITFETNSSIVVGDLTNVKEVLLKEINNLTTGNMTNYYQTLKNVDEVLDGYEKEENRELIVLFLTDGYPNEDIPNEVGEYEYLKSKYPYITINGVQYEMGSAILDPIVKISDNQYVADMKTLENVLFEAAVATVPYDEFTIIDYINDDYFNIESINNISVTKGNVRLDGNKITWDLTPFRSGFDAKMTIDITLKDEFSEKGGYYPTNKGEEVRIKLGEQEENLIISDTPVLKENYNVIYDGNNTACSSVEVPDTKSYSVFSTVEKSEDIPVCQGYQFKGWEIVNNGVTKVNDDYFLMPEEDVVIRAVWSKLSLSKTVDGSVYTAVGPYHELCNDNSIACHVAKTYDTDGHLIYHNVKNATSKGATFTYNSYGAEDKSYRYAGAEYILADGVSEYATLYDTNSEANGVIKRYCSGGADYSYVGVFCNPSYYTEYYYLAYDEDKTQYKYIEDAEEKALKDGYSKRNMHNYLCFGSNEEVCPDNNLYRIIGIFNVANNGIEYFDDAVTLEKDDYINLVNDEVYKWNWNDDNKTWASTNKIDNTSGIISFSVKEKGDYQICYTQVSEEEYDYTTVKVNNKVVLELKYDSSSYKCAYIDNIDEDDIITVSYDKDEESSDGKDEVTFYIQKGIYSIVGKEKDKYQIKLIKNDSIGSHRWSGEVSDKSNKWSESILNTEVLNGNTAGSFYYDLGEVWNSKIALHTYKIAGMDTYGRAKTTYKYELGVKSGDTTYDGKVAMMYVTDYGFAAGIDSWLTKMSSYNLISHNNWLYYGRDEWFLTPAKGSDISAFYIESNGKMSPFIINVTFANVIRPVFYLNGAVEYVKGTGTISDPYRVN